MTPKEEQIWRAMRKIYAEDESLNSILKERAAACGSCAKTKFDRAEMKAGVAVVYLKCGACNCPSDLNDKIAKRRQTCPLKRWEPVFK